MSEYLACLNPKVIHNPYLDSLVTVPCGECDACRALHSSQWAQRLEIESTFHRYTYFLTLTYTDDKLPMLPVTVASDDDDYTRACVMSSDYISAHDGFIPCLRFKDLQLFFKRIRRYIDYDYKKGFYKEKPVLRYFVCGEYGPTTFRPHYHMLLWFDCDTLNARVKEYIYKSWQHSNTCSEVSEFFRRNKFSRVVGSAARYVAGYINSNTDLPPVLFLRSFRAKHIQSSSPAIGCTGAQHGALQTLFNSFSNEISYITPFTGMQRTVPLWKSLESRLYPRCPAFASLSRLERYAIFRLSSTFGVTTNYDTFKQRFYNEWTTFGLSPFYSLVLRVTRCADISEIKDTQLKRLFYFSRQCSKSAQEFGLALYDFFLHAEEYFSRKNYDSLVSQLQFEETFCHQNSENIKYLPSIIDIMFAGNERQLSSYTNYLTQFHLDALQLHLYTYKDSLPYHRSKSLFGRMMSENNKTRRKKDFIANHPEYENYYVTNIFNTLRL